MKFTIAPKDTQAFTRLCNVGFLDRTKREFTFDEWFGRRDTKGRILEVEVNPDIRGRLMREHLFTVFQ